MAVSVSIKARPSSTDVVAVVTPTSSSRRQAAPANLRMPMRPIRVPSLRLTYNHNHNHRLQPILIGATQSRSQFLLASPIQPLKRIGCYKKDFPFDIPQAHPSFDWNHGRGLSFRARRTLHTLSDPSFDVNGLDKILQRLLDADPEQVSRDIWGILKGLGWFEEKYELALRVFEWFRSKAPGLVSGHVIAMVIEVVGNAGSGWGRDRMISSLASLLHNLKANGIELDEYGYSSLIRACIRNRLYYQALEALNKMQEVGYTPPLLPSELFEEMKLAGLGLTPNEETYKAMLEVHCKSGRPKAATGLVKEMERNGFTPRIATYNSLI